MQEAETKHSIKQVIIRAIGLGYMALVGVIAWKLIKDADFRAHWLRLVIKGSFIWTIGAFLAINAVRSGRVPKYLKAQFSLSETERQRKLRAINNDPMA